LLAGKGVGSKEQDQSKTYKETFHFWLRDSAAESPVALANFCRRTPHRMDFLLDSKLRRPLALNELNSISFILAFALMSA